MKFPAFSRIRVFASAAFSLALLSSLSAESFTKSYSVDFYRDVSSRKLKGFATRSDGRLLAGPFMRDLNGTLPTDLVWSLAPGAGEDTWYLGTGPDGRIFEVKLDCDKGSFTSKELIKIDDSQVFSLLKIDDSTLLAGTSPKGGLVLIRNGKTLARVALPVDSVFDLLPCENTGPVKSVLVATGNPGVIYRVDLARLALAGLSSTKSTGADLAAKGITVFGEIHDRNVRRLARLADGRIVVGSAPKGNIYTMPSDGGAPVFLMENKDSEVTDLLALPDGGLYVSLVPSGTMVESRFKSPARQTPQATPAAAPQALPAPPGPSPMQAAPAAAEAQSSSDPFSGPAVEKFAGRGVLLYIPAGGFPELVSSRSGQAFYRLVRHDDWVLISGGEQGDVFGYDSVNRMSLTFAGSTSAQMNDIRPLSPKGDRYLLLRNNPVGLSLLDFNATESRSIETRKLDIGQASAFGALRFGRLCQIPNKQLSVETRVSAGSDETEGWTPWETLAALDGAAINNAGWRTANPQKGRYAHLRIKLPAGVPATAEIDRALWFFTPQNRRPQLTEFRTLSTNFGLIVSPESAPQTSQTLSQVLSQSALGENAGDKRKSNFQNSQIVPSPGSQVFTWTVSDADGDSLAATFSMRREGETEWNPVVVDAVLPYAQVEISHMPEGVYHTRLVVSEQAPRPKSEQLHASFDTDDFVIDRSAPEFLEAEARLLGDQLVIRVHAKDALSIVEGIEVQLNNGARSETGHPVDGICDSREETFQLEIPRERVSGATQAEVLVFDSVGNRSARVLKWK